MAALQAQAHNFYLHSTNRLYSVNYYNIVLLKNVMEIHKYIIIQLHLIVNMMTYTFFF